MKYEEDTALFSFVMISETVALQMIAQHSEIREESPRRECSVFKTAFFVLKRIRRQNYFSFTTVYYH